MQINTGAQQLPNCVVNNGTYNVMQLETKPDAVSLALEMYGTQNVHIRLADYKPHSVKNLSRDLTINFWNWNEQEMLCVINVTAEDIQGVQGEIIVQTQTNGLSSME